jgi:hypothetical protein
MNFEDENTDRENDNGFILSRYIALGGFTVRFPAGAENFSLHHCIQNVSGAHPAS